MQETLKSLADKPRLLILSGLPASGKSTYAKEWLSEDADARICINWDEARIARYGENWKFNRKEENEMKRASYDTARIALNKGFSVIIDNTNLTPKARDTWRAIGQNSSAEVIEHEIDTPVLECVRRDRNRVGRSRVGRAVIERMALFNGFIDWQDYKGQFIVCDIDGTLSDPSHRLHWVKDQDYTCKPDCKATELQRLKGGCQVCGSKPPHKDRDKFHEEVTKDTLKEPIARLLGHFRSLGYHIIICSGRWLDKGCGIKTEDWLERHGIQYDHLFMRNGGDSRPDWEIKQEILELLPKDRIAYVLDDRDQVVNMWRRNGLTCLQVSEGKF